MTVVRILLVVSRILMKSKVSYTYNMSRLAPFRWLNIFVYPFGNVFDYFEVPISNSL